VVGRHAGELDAGARRALGALLDGLPERFSALSACGVPDTLVHGDFHPGNFRGGGGGAVAGPGGVVGRMVLIDWADCGIGHALLDQAQFLDSVDPRDRPAVAARWARLWRDAVPGCDPEAAAALLAPVAALRQAILYRRFLDAIEPSERVYHAGDPATWLARAAALSTDARLSE
jgi:Ser/Thr protein kinase RdoA (MazF antagonist)